MNKELVAIFEYLEREKGIKRDFICRAIEEALMTGARKGQTQMNNVTVTIDDKTGEIKAVAEKEVVDHVEYPNEEILLEEAQELDPDCEIEDWIQIPMDPESFGRIAAQVTRQLISQKLRSAERDVIYEEYRHRKGELISGSVRRITKGHTLIIDLGKVEGILPGRFYPKNEEYHLGEKVVALLYDVQDTENGGAEIVLSRSHAEFVQALFEQEVPEISDNLITINRAVRDAGFRTKIAVSSSDPKIDPVGACVGVRGTRVKNIIRELNNEKIDVLPFSEDPFVLLKSSLSPIEVNKAEYDEEQDLITLIVEDDDYPAVLGKKGNNARLTSELIGIKLIVRKKSEYQKELTVIRNQLAAGDDPKLDEPLNKLEGINQFIADSIMAAGFNTARKVLETSPVKLSTESGISLNMAEDIMGVLEKLFESSNKDLTEGLEAETNDDSTSDADSTPGDITDRAAAEESIDESSENKVMDTSSNEEAEE